MTPTRATVCFRGAWLALLAALVLTSVARAEEPAGEDPFAPENFIEFKKETAQPAPGSKEPATAKYIDFEVALMPRDVRRGEIATLTIYGTPKPGWRTYPITERSGDTEDGSKGSREVQHESGLSKLTFEEVPGLKPLWPIRESEPQWKIFAPEVTRAHTTPFTWSQDLLVLPDAEPGVKTVRFKVQLSLCDATRCLPPGTHTFEVRLNVTGTRAPAGALPADVQKRLEEKKPPVKVLPVPAELKKKAEAEAARARVIDDGMKGALPVPPIQPRLDDYSLLGLFAASSLAALGMLFTPCVFPMIPITVSFFLKQAEKKHYNAKLTAGVYALTIIVLLSTAVLVLGQVVIRLANNPWLNLAFGGLLAFFALSLFGMYEIELPSFLSSWTSSRERQGGYFGAFFMALTFTITSFTCTGPFLGPLLIAAKEFQVSTGKLVFAAVVYSATFAAPFWLMAMFPQLLKALPKSGSWLNSVKVVMGFIELAAAMKFLAITDATWNPGNPWFFNYDTVLCAWIALSFACGLYLLGVYRLPHDSPLESVGVPRLVLAALFFGFAVYITPALWRDRPLGIVGEGLMAWLPRDSRPAEQIARGRGGERTELTWHTDYAKAYAQAKKENKLLFIDFTGTNCQNCRQNEFNVFPLPGVQQELTKYVRVQLYTDNVPDRSLTADQSQELAARNLAWQGSTFSDISLPLYVIFKPDPDKMEADGKLQGTVLGRHAGIISNANEFVEMLRRPHGGAQVAQAGGVR